MTASIRFGEMTGIAGQRIHRPPALRVNEIYSSNSSFEEAWNL